MPDLLVPNIFCFQTQKQLPTLNNIQVLLKSVLTVRFMWFRASENLFACTLLHTRHCVSNLSSPDIDIFLISKTKLNDSFPTAQFLIKGFGAPYRFDRNSKGSGLLLYICEDITSKILTYSCNCDIETLFVEINLRKGKWFLNNSYNSNKS